MRVSVLVLASAGVFLISTPTRAAEPAWWTQQKAQCGLPPNLAYNTWTAQGSPCGGSSYQPVQDPRVGLHNRVSAVIAANPDLIDASAANGVNLWDDNAFAGLIARIHGELWQAYAGYDGLAKDRRWQAAYYRQPLDGLEAFASQHLNAARADSVPQAVVDAHDRAQAEAKIASDDLEGARHLAVSESLGTVFSAVLWAEERNKALATLRARFPKARGLPSPTDIDASGDASHPPIPAGPFHAREPGPEPTLLTGAMPVLAPAWNPDGLAFRHATANPEPPLPASLDAQVSTLENLARAARRAKTDAAAAASDLAAMGERYASYYRIDEAGLENTAQLDSDTNRLQRRTTWLEQKRTAALVEVRNATWQRVFATTKALVWQTLEEKVIPAALRDMAHAPPVEKAKKYKALLDQVIGIEQDFELWSPRAAHVLAYGSPGEAQHMLDGVWGVTTDQGRETMDKALDAADAPEPLRKAVYRLAGLGGS